MACLLCNNAIETQDYLFLHCDLARAVWFGADIPIIHLTEATITVDIWVKDLLKQHNDLNNNTYDLQMILTLLWFLQTSSNNAGNTGWVRNIVHATSWTPDTNWQVLITTAGGAAKNGTRHGMTYMGKNRDGQRMIILIEDKDIEQMWGSNHLSKWQLTTIFEDIKNLQQQHLSLHIKATPKQVLKETKSMALTASRTFLDVYHEYSMFCNSGSR
uniref:Reverse transcriptase zinc-binding domain-containing protein n=1 Tax=Fagus sylvatica TaxID=28930 RepID=A0A2N9GLJ1_FAGSY